MEPLIIQGTDNSPGVIFDTSANRFNISGRSRPENAGKFYVPVINWITEFEKTLSDRKQEMTDDSTLVFEFKLEYFNSTSAKHLAEIILLLKDFIVKGYKINIEWHFAKFDDDMLDTGKEFSNMVDLQFDFIEY
jgi:hypothetical protein